MAPSGIMVRPWIRRVDTRSGDMAHGITFVMHELLTENTRGEAARGSKKLHVSGFASLTLALNQHKYGDELIAQVFSQGEGFVTDRRADGWTRVQVFLGPADIGAAEMLEAVAKEIRARAAKKEQA